MADITILIMSKSNTHQATKNHLRHEKWGIVDVFTQGRLQRQAEAFYTINTTTAGQTLDEVREYLLEQVWSYVTIEPELLARRKHKIKPVNVTQQEKDTFLNERHIDLTWQRFTEFIT